MNFYASFAILALWPELELATLSDVVEAVPVDDPEVVAIESDGHAAVLGVGYGVYLSVDFALCTEVLPAAEARAKDLGVINIAVALPQVFAPFVGSFLVANAGGYVTLYAVSCAVCVLGSVFVRNIHGVR